MSDPWEQRESKPKNRRGPEHLEAFIAALRAIKADSPNLRICQIISIACANGGWRGDDLFHVEDDDLARWVCEVGGRHAPPQKRMPSGALMCPVCGHAENGGECQRSHP